MPQRSRISRRAGWSSCLSCINPTVQYDVDIKSSPPPQQPTTDTHTTPVPSTPTRESCVESKVIKHHIRGVSDASTPTQGVGQSSASVESTPCQASPSPWATTAYSMPTASDASASDDPGPADALFGSLADTVGEEEDVQLMRRYILYLRSGNHRMKAYAAEALHRAATAPRPHRATIAMLLYSSDVLVGLVDLLRGGNDQGRIYAASTLQALADADGPLESATSKPATPESRMAEVDDSTAITTPPQSSPITIGADLAEAGAAEALLAAGCTAMLPAARRAALNALARVLRHREAAICLAASAGGVSLVALISNPDEPPYAVRGALLALYYFGADKAPIQEHLAAVGVVAPLLDLAARGRRRKLAHPALQVIKVLAKSFACAQLLVAAGGIGVLQAAARDESETPAAREAAAVALERLSLVLVAEQDLPSSNGKGSILPNETGCALHTRISVELSLGLLFDVSSSPRSSVLPSPACQSLPPALPNGGGTATPTSQCSAATSVGCIDLVPPPPLRLGCCLPPLPDGAAVLRPGPAKPAQQQQLSIADADGTALATVISSSTRTTGSAGGNKPKHATSKNAYTCTVGDVIDRRISGRWDAPARLARAPATSTPLVAATCDLGPFAQPAAVALVEAEASGPPRQQEQAHHQISSNLIESVASARALSSLASGTAGMASRRCTAPEYAVSPAPRGPCMLCNNSSGSHSAGAQRYAQPLVTACDGGSSASTLPSPTCQQGVRGLPPKAHTPMVLLPAEGALPLGRADSLTAGPAAGSTHTRSWLARPSAAGAASHSRRSTQDLEGAEEGLLQQSTPAGVTSHHSLGHLGHTAASAAKRLLSAQTMQPALSPHGARRSGGGTASSGGSTPTGSGCPVTTKWRWRTTSAGGACGSGGSSGDGTSTASAAVPLTSSRHGASAAPQGEPAASSSRCTTGHSPASDDSSSSLTDLITLPAAERMALSVAVMMAPGGPDSRTGARHSPFSWVSVELYAEGNTPIPSPPQRRQPLAMDGLHPSPSTSSLQPMQKPLLLLSSSSSLHSLQQMAYVPPLPEAEHMQQQQQQQRWRRTESPPPVVPSTCTRNHLPPLIQQPALGATAASSAEWPDAPRSPQHKVVCVAHVDLHHPHLVLADISDASLGSSSACLQAAISGTADLEALASAAAASRLPVSSVPRPTHRLAASLARDPGLSRILRPGASTASHLARPSAGAARRGRTPAQPAGSGAATRVRSAAHHPSSAGGPKGGFFLPMPPQLAHMGQVAGAHLGCAQLQGPTGALPSPGSHQQAAARFRSNMQLHLPEAGSSPDPPASPAPLRDDTLAAQLCDRGCGLPDAAGHCEGSPIPSAATTLAAGVAVAAPCTVRRQDLRDVSAGTAVAAAGTSSQGVPVPQLCDSPRRPRWAVGASEAARDPRDSTDELLQTASDGLDGFLLDRQDVAFCRGTNGRKVRLGEGGFGAVYKAIMNGVDEVAVKVVKKTSPSKRELETFLQEVSTLGRLHHRNIVQLYGACLKPGCLFLVTELMRGGDLYHALRNHPDLMRWDVLGRKVALDIALGLNYLHNQKPRLMHRDLKSPNVLLSEEGVAKVADVGMSRTQVGDVVTAQPLMTPLWAAPEVVRRDKASIKADIWSMGVLVWEIVTCCDITEFQPLAISRQMGTAGPRTLTMPADAPPAAMRVFDACTLMDPTKRPSTAQIVGWLRDS